MTRQTVIPVSVLDLAWREHGKQNSDAVRASLDLVRVAEGLGYRRHWFAAHHGLPVSAASQPTILMAAAAAITSTIRVGAGPLLLPNYRPLVVAEQFGTLKALFGDRIDLGIGRSSGGLPSPSGRATGRGQDFPSDVLELLRLFHGGATDAPLAVPGLGDAPETWMLGSTSGVSARIAGSLGLPFAYGHHFAPDDTERVLDLYRTAFRPSAFLLEPYSMVTVIAIAADTQEDLRQQTHATEATHLRLLRGLSPDPVPLDGTSTATFTPAEEATLIRYRHRQAVGTPDVVEESLRSLITSTGADEIMVQAVASTAAGRRRTLEIVSDVLIAP